MHLCSGKILTVRPKKYQTYANFCLHCYINSLVRLEVETCSSYDHIHSKGIFGDGRMLAKWLEIFAKGWKLWAPYCFSQNFGRLVQ
jgi:hypothetical protein